MSDQKYRLVTRSDFDGLVCAVLLKELDMIDEILFVHPKDMQDGKVYISERDITTNLPYVDGAYMVFDHHESEITRVGKKSNHIIEAHSPSAARVVYNYFGGKERFPMISKDMMDAVDQGDAAQFAIEEILDAKGWPLLNFIMDARTGLGRFKEFRISNYQLMMKLIDLCKTQTIQQILKNPDVQERIDLYQLYESRFKEQLKRIAVVHDKVVVLDLREEEVIYPGNRFMIYALFPEVTVSIHVLWGLKKQNTVFAVGKSIFNKSSEVNIGELMLKFGGGGHAAAGTCQVDNDEVDKGRRVLLMELNKK